MYCPGSNRLVIRRLWFWQAMLANCWPLPFSKTSTGFVTCHSAHSTLSESEVMVSPEGRVFYHRKDAEEYYGQAAATAWGKQSSTPICTTTVTHDAVTQRSSHGARLGKPNHPCIAGCMTVMKLFTEFSSEWQWTLLLACHWLCSGCWQRGSLDRMHLTGL